MALQKHVKIHQNNMHVLFQPEIKMNTLHTTMVLKHLRFGDNLFGWGGGDQGRPRGPTCGATARLSGSFKQHQNFPGLWQRVVSLLTYTMTRQVVRDTKATSDLNHHSAGLSFVYFKYVCMWWFSMMLFTLLLKFEKLINETPILLREYPVGYGIRFVHAMKYFQKEKSPVISKADVNWHCIYSICFPFWSFHPKRM